MPRVALDIGSTVVKLAILDDDGETIDQRHFPRDHDAGIPAQVRGILDACEPYCDGDDVLVCSSANGGLRAGVLCLSERFSGATLRDQVLLAGDNPVFVHEFDDQPTNAPVVDVLVVGGGIDDDDCAPMRTRIGALDLGRYRFDALVYAGNAALADVIRGAFADAVLVRNPLAHGLNSECDSVFEAIRDAYLNDLVHKAGISELPANLLRTVRPTPEVVNRGFRRMISGRTARPVSGATVVIDIGGATTDLHYTVEIVRDDSPEKPAAGSSVARYVFTDLGIHASRESASMQLRAHPRIFEFLSIVQADEIRETYRRLREGSLEPDGVMLAYGCLFIALDRFSTGRGPGLPMADLKKVSNIVLTGGAVQSLDATRVRELVGLFGGDIQLAPHILVDDRYRLWIDGIV